MGTNDVPCRVTADLRKYEREQDEAMDRAAEQRFDPWDDALMRDLFGETLAQPMADFLIAWRQVETTEQSFGADRAKAFDFLRPHLASLKDACLKVYEEEI